MIDPSAPLPSLVPAIDAAATEWPSLEALRLQYIHRAIEHAGGNKTHAAELLGIDRRTLNRTLARERRRARTQTLAK